jgi:hypothetical protein
MRVRLHQLSPVLLAGTVVVAAHTLPWGDRFAALGLWRGPLGLALLTLGLAITFYRVGVRPPALRLTLAARFVCAALLYSSIGLFHTRSVAVTGDEPHYLLMAQSLWQERDLDLRDNMLRRDYLPYSAGFEPHYGAPRLDGRPFPAHSPGLSILLAPFLAVGGRTACILVLSLLAAWLALETYRLALVLGGDPRAAGWAWLLTLGPPVIFYSFSIYTEIPSALALCLAARLLLSGRGLGRALLAALCASTLPWLHVKLIPAALALAIVASVRLGNRERVAFLAFSGLAAALYCSYYVAIFGTPLPFNLYGYGGPIPRGVKRSTPFTALPGLLFDRAFGLLPFAPAFLLALCVPGRRLAAIARQVWPIGLLVVAVASPAVFWRIWWAGQSPPARFLVPLVPFLAVLAGIRISSRPQGLGRWRVALLGWGFGLALFIVLQPNEHLLLSTRGSPSPVWSQLSPLAERYLPALVDPEAHDWRALSAWLVALAVIFFADAMAPRHPRVDRLWQGLAFPLLCLLGVTLGLNL